MGLRAMLGLVFLIGLSCAQNERNRVDFADLNDDQVDNIVGKSRPWFIQEDFEEGVLLALKVFLNDEVDHTYVCMGIKEVQKQWKHQSPEQIKAWEDGLDKDYVDKYTKKIEDIANGCTHGSGTGGEGRHCTNFDKRSSRLAMCMFENWNPDAVGLPKTEGEGTTWLKKNMKNLMKLDTNDPTCKDDMDKWQGLKKLIKNEAMQNEANTHAKECYRLMEDIREKKAEITKQEATEAKAKKAEKKSKYDNKLAEQLRGTWTRNH